MGQKEGEELKIAEEESSLFVIPNADSAIAKGFFF